MIKQEIHWNEAVQIAEQNKVAEEQASLKYQENLQEAVYDVWDAMGSDFFNSEDVAHIAMDYGVDEEDLIFTLI